MATKTDAPKRVNIVGQGVPRLDADEKVRGRAEYADDLNVPNAWYGYVVRSPVPRGRIRALNPDPDYDWSRVVVVTPEDIPGNNIVDMMGRDMPFIAHDEIQYRGEPIALVAGPTRKLAREAAAHMHADIEEYPPLLTLCEMIDRYKNDPSALHELCAQTIRKGDADRALKEADRVVEGEYWAGHQEQLYIEPQGMVATPEPDGSVFIHGSMQCPYFINPELCETLDLPPEKIRVKQSAVGGAFGGKEEFPTLLAGYCALLALKSKRPVKIIYDRHQDILYSTKRHPVWTRYRSGLNKDGSIRAIHVDYVLDGGAYTTLSPVVMYRGILHSAMGYRCDNVFVDGHVYRTNTFPSGAFRGFGAPQAIWGLESHVDELAAACGMAPHEFRLRNALREGDSTPTGGVLRHSVGSQAVLTQTLERSGMAEKLARGSRGNPGDKKWYGVGMSFFAHGAGFTGDGEARIKAKVALDLETDEDGQPVVNVRVSSTEMGQGTFTILPQVAADGLSVDLDTVRCPYPDTKYVPDSGPTVASRTAMVVGSTVHGAALQMKTQLEEYVSHAMLNGQPVELSDGLFEGSYAPPRRSNVHPKDPVELIEDLEQGFHYERTIPFKDAAAHHLKHRGPLRVYHHFRLPDYIHWDQKNFVGDAYPSYSWGCNVAEVEVDPLTLEVHVRRVTAIYDIGKVLNPVLAKGQLEGGLVQALGYALMEKIEVKEGLFDASRMQTYVIPTTLDIPEFDLGFVEFPYEFAVPGAKGVGEIPMDGLAPAIANAVEQASGVRMRELPITPEKLFAALLGKEKQIA